MSLPLPSGAGALPLHSRLPFTSRFAPYRLVPASVRMSSRTDTSSRIQVTLAGTFGW